MPPVLTASLSVPAGDMKGRSPAVDHQRVAVSEPKTTI
jgi:hypothetical protein